MSESNQLLAATKSSDPKRVAKVLESCRDDAKRQVLLHSQHEFVYEGVTLKLNCLFYAILHDHTAVAKYLIMDHLPDLSLSFIASFLTPAQPMDLLALAVHKNNADIVKALLLRARTTGHHFDFTALRLAWYDRNLKLQKLLTDSGNCNGSVVTKTITIFIVSLNTRSELPPQNLDRLFSPMGFENAESSDVILITLQETTYPQIDFSDYEHNPENWEEAINIAVGIKYKFVKYIRNSGTVLMLYAKRAIYKMLDDITCDSCPREDPGCHSNSLSAVAVSLKVFDSRLCFVCASLTSGLKANKQRNEDYKTMCKELAFSLTSPAKSLEIFDHEYESLNYHLQGIWGDQMQTMVTQRRYGELLQYDQLKRAQKKSQAFAEFSESDIAYSPERIISNGPKYSNEVKRLSSAGSVDDYGYAQRILFQQRAPHCIAPIAYSSIPDVSNNGPTAAFSSLAGLFCCEVFQLCDSASNNSATVNQLANGIAKHTTI